jgi:serine/threonine protein kinase
LDRKQVLSLDEAYDVYEVLGRGGFGIVRRACLLSGGPSCAVKSIPRRCQHSEELAHSEARILKCLSHVGINKLLSVCEDAEHIHLVLELVNGHELFDEIVDRVPLRETRAACIMKQVLAALQYCHDPQRSVIHRDIKPENIMINESICENMPQVKIIDWGLAIVCEDTVQTPVVGTACYLAPESLQEGRYSRASDMWSVGAVLHMLLSGGTLPEQFSSSSLLKINLLQDLGTSDAALRFLDSLLSSSACQRLTAQSASQTAWICGQASDCNNSKQDLANERVNVTDGKLVADSKHPLPLTESRQANCLGVLSVDFSLGRDDDFIIFDDFKHAQFEVGTPEKRKGNKQRSRKVEKMEKSKENYGIGEKATSWEQKTKLLGGKPDRISIQRPLLLR